MTRLQYLYICEWHSYPSSQLVIDYMASAMGLKKALRWLPRSSASPRLEEDEDNNERNGLLRSHRDQNRVVPVTDLHVDEQPKAGAHVEPKTVTLKVSMHCHGCARKVQKQISKLHGVVSIRIELGIKTVTVVGNVTPMEVLETVSKVIKYAHILPPP